MTARESLMKRRNLSEGVKTSNLTRCWEKELKLPVYCQFGIRRIDDMTYIKAFEWNTGTPRKMLRERTKAVAP